MRQAEICPGAVSINCCCFESPSVKGSSEITVTSCSCHPILRQAPPPPTSIFWASHVVFHFLSPQQPNIKQKFVALLKRFKVTDEVGSVFSLYTPRAPPRSWLWPSWYHLYHTSTLPLHVRGSECVFASEAFAEIDMYFSFGFEDTERCVGEMWQQQLRFSWQLI